MKEEAERLYDQIEAMKAIQKMNEEEYLKMKRFTDYQIKQLEKQLEQLDGTIVDE